MLKLRIPDRNTPRWLVFFADLFLVSISLMLAYLIRFDFKEFPIAIEWPALKIALPIFILVRASIFYFLGTYKGMIRHTGTADSKRIFLALTLGTAVFFLLVPLRVYYDGLYFLPISILVMEYLCSLFLMITLRIAVKLFYIEQKNTGAEKLNVMIYGAGEMGVITKRTLEQDATVAKRIVAFVDDNDEKKGKSIEGAQVYHTSRIDEIIQEKVVKQIIVAMLNPDPENKRKVIEAGLRHGVEILNVPPVTNWIDGKLKATQLKKINIEDLLGRKPIQLDKKNISNDINGKNILVTGGAGSIGSEIVRQVLKFEPKKVFILDQAESPLYDLENELRSKGHKNFEVVIADIRNYNRMENVFKSFTPSIVYHAAAYKHVPLMEENPSEAIFTNINGTKITADLSEKYGVAKFVFISTDKAVNPTNVMGASKRVAEIYIQTKNKSSQTKYVTTRFGNVLGSNGSVIPLFKKQLDQGLPLTVTDKNVTRYFMTIPEACQLVLEAGAMGKGGEIFVFDMGDKVKILDLAEKMIRLSGLEPYKDVQIVFTGLRPGEKLYEELLNEKESVLPTHHAQIMIGKVRSYEATEINPKIEKLISLFNGQNNNELVTAIKEMVPEFISNNSIFEKLDK
ncbi:MAG TPA: nucleoside-diphosphate sugar epimerase/dehydratase [Flavobacteriales bacterium]|nr:nucleoside-diphosphate sugar epimerase/dehydratase [Flavobacteriales bacterium]